MIEPIELYFLDVIHRKKRGFWAVLLLFCLLPISWIYRVIVAFRNWSFDQGWIRSYSPPIPVVISVGNIVAGGTGKTPVTLMLAREFSSSSSVAIISRGYRSKAEKMATPIVLSKGQGPMHPASYCGDEPYMLAQNLPGVCIFVGKDRHKASNIAAKAGAQLLLLDDGMQHRRLARDFEVVVIDAFDPFGQGYFLPRGLLRESLRSLARADVIVLNHAYDTKRCTLVRQKIARYTTAPVVTTKTEVEGIYTLQGEQETTFSCKKVGIFCGIAHPDYFEKTVADIGLDVVERYVIPDHMEYNPEALICFALKCKASGAECLICTEKDRVKLVEKLDIPLPIFWIRMKLVFVEGESFWKDFVLQVKQDLAHRL